MVRDKKVTTAVMYRKFLYSLVIFHVKCRQGCDLSGADTQRYITGLHNGTFLSGRLHNDTLQSGMLQNGTAYVMNSIFCPKG
jgi:hypothetical protein